MARKRMFDLEIVDTDLFLEMPQSTQNLYFHLGMRADDDGFVSNPKKIIRTIGANDDDLKILLTKQFIIPFESGIVVIRHWKLNNYLRKDRYVETIYKEEKKQLSEDENGVYNLNVTVGIPNGNQNATNGIHSIVENSKEENSIDKNSSSSVNNLYDSQVEKLQKIMLETIGTTNTNNIMECADYLKQLPIELIEYALRKTARIERPSWQYAIPILDSYVEKHFKTIDEVKADDLNHKSKNKTQSGKMDDFKELMEEAKIIDEQTGNNTSNNTFGW